MPLPKSALYALCGAVCLTILAVANAEDAAPAPDTITEATIVAIAGEVNIPVRDVLIRMILTEGDGTLKRLLTRRMVLVEAAKRGVTVTPEQLQATLQTDLAAYRAELAKHSPPDAKNFTDDQIIRARFQVPLTTYRDRELRYALLLQGLILDQLDLRPETLRAWYEQEKDRYGVPARYQVRHILIKYDPAPDRWTATTAGERDLNRAGREAALVRAREKINQIYELLKAGQAFEQMEKKYSEESPETKARGGALPPIDIFSPIDENFFAAARKLAVGECSPPVLTPFGYHLILMDQIVPGQYPTYDTIADRVRGDYIREQATRRSGPLVEGLAQATEITHYPRVYPAADEDLAAPTPQPNGRVPLSACLAVIGRVPVDATNVERSRAITRRDFYAELWRTAGQRFIEERAALGLYLQSIRKTPAEPTAIEVSKIFSEDQVQCYTLQDRAIAEARKRGQPEPPRRKFYDYMMDLTHRTPAELMEDARERAALWKFMQMKFPWSEDELQKYFYIEKERYDRPGELQLALIRIAPQTDPAAADPEKPSQPVATADRASVTQWQTASDRAKTMYKHLRGGGLPADADRRIHPGALSWDYAAKRMSDAPEDVAAAAGAWPALKVVRVPRVAEIVQVNADRSGYELVVLEFDTGLGREALGLLDHQISAPIRAADGFYILRRDQFTPPIGRNLDEDEVRRQVERDYVTPRIRKNLQPLLDQLLAAQPVQIRAAVLDRLMAGDGDESAR